jgi:hypothetical protein
VTVPISDPLVVAMAQRLRQGGHAFTARQLYYAVCAEIVEPRRPQGRGLIAFGIIVVACGALVARARSLPVVLIMSAGLGAALIIVGGLTVYWDAQRRARPRSLMIPLSFEAFAREHLDPVRERRAQGLDGIIEVATAPAPRRIAKDAVIVVTDSDETTAMLVANAAHLPPGLAVLGETAAQKRVRGRAVVAVHDADPRGCELPARLREAGASAVADAGITPPPSDVDLPVIEGAPARLPRDLTGELGEVATRWLRSGRRLELASRTPADVCALVTAAVAALREPASSAS